MSFTVPAIDAHAEAIKTALAANGKGVLVDRSRKPQGAGWQGTPGQSRFVGYIVIHPLAGGTHDGPAGDPSADIRWLVQLTCVGATAAQADQVGDLAAELLMSSRTAIAVTGRRLAAPITRESVGPARPDPTLGDSQTLFYATPIFRVWTTPT